MSGTGSTASEILARARRHGLAWLTGVRGGLLALILLTGLVAGLHREVLFSGSVYHMDDAADCYYPGRVAYRRALSEGTLPSWEPNTLAGWPLLADPYYGYFYPLNFVFYLGPRRGEPATGFEGGVPAGLGISAALHAILAGGAMYAYLRRRRRHGEPLSFGAALFGALSYALSSFMVVRIRHIIFIQILAWLPLLLLFLDDYLERRQRRSLALVGLLFGVMLLTGAHSILHFVVLLLGVYGLARWLWIVADQPAGTRLRTASTLIGPLGLAVAAGALLGAVALLPTLSAMPNTTRSLGTDYKFASSYAWPSLRYLVLLFAPDSMGLGESRQHEWFAPWNHWELAGYYPGLIAAVLALPGALLPRRGQWRGWPWARAVADAAPTSAARRRRQSGWLWRTLDGERLGLLLCLLFGVALALGDQGPLHPFLYRYFPLYAALRCPSRGLILFVVAAPILAAHAVEFLFGAASESAASNAATAAPTPRLSSLRVALGISLALVLLGLAGYLAWRAQAGVATALPPMRPALRSRAQVELLLGGLLALLSLRYICRVRGLLLLLPLCTLSVSDQWLTDRGYVLPQPLGYPAGMERFHAIEWLRQKASEPIAGQAVPDRFVADPRGPFRLLAVGETLGIPSASGYGSVQIWRYAQLLYILRHGRPYPHRKQVDDMAAAGVWNFRSPIVDMLNIRYLIWTDPPSPKWQQVLAAPMRQPASARFEPGWDAQLAVFENRQVMPRAYLTQSLRWAADEAEEARLIAQPDFDPHAQTLVGPVPPLARRAWPDLAIPWPPLPDAKGAAATIQPAQIVTYERHRVVVEAEAASPAMLVLADAYYPGWSATVDGVPQPIYPANLALRGVPLSAGKHRIEFRYAQAPLRRGLWLSALGLILLAALGWLPLRRRGQAAEGAQPLGN